MAKAHVEEDINDIEIDDEYPKMEIDFKSRKYLFEMDFKNGVGEFVDDGDKENQKWYKKITVEPILFLYIFAFMITNVIEQDLFLQKICRINKNYPVDICNNIKNISNEKYKIEVQKTMSNYLLAESVLGNMFSITISLFIGSFSDHYGRKLPLLFGLFGKMIYSFMVIVNILVKSWSIEYILFTALLPCVLTGSDIAIFTSCFSYISDVSSKKNLTFRVTLLNACYLFAIPVGVQLGSYLFNNCFGESYLLMFSLNLFILCIAFIYGIYSLHWRTTIEQDSLKNINKKKILTEIFQKKHLKETVEILTEGINKKIILLVLISSIMFSFLREEGKYLYIYSVFKFGWDIKTYSIFKTTKAFLYFITVLVCTPIMNKIFKWKETIIIFIGIVMNLIARVFYYVANNSILFYLGGLSSILGPTASPMYKSLLSKLVSENNRGKAFSLLFICDTAVPLLSGVCYSQAYRYTLNSSGGIGIFVLSFVTQIFAFVLITVAQILNKRKDNIKKINEMDTFVSISLNEENVL